MKCKICELRKPRRYCPGIQADICSICCGNEREVSISCPFDCPYLQEARAHEKRPEIDKDKAPNSDIEISDSFLHRHKELVLYLGFALAGASVNQPGVVDSDVRDALDALTRTYRSLSSGLYYDSRPVNPYADGVYSSMREAIAEMKAEAQKTSFSLRDAEVLGILVMYQRLALTFDNGRPKGRSFIDTLRTQFAPGPPAPEPESPLIEL
jgi:hypothetical protein